MAHPAPYGARLAENASNLTARIMSWERRQLYNGFYENPRDRSAWSAPRLSRLLWQRLGRDAEPRSVRHRGHRLRLAHCRSTRTASNNAVVWPQRRVGPLRLVWTTRFGFDCTGCRAL